MTDDTPLTDADLERIEKAVEFNHYRDFTRMEILQAIRELRSLLAAAAPFAAETHEDGWPAKEFSAAYSRAVDILRAEPSMKAKLTPDLLAAAKLVLALLDAGCDITNGARADLKLAVDKADGGVR